MQIILTEAFQRDVDHLSSREREQLFSVILKLRTAIREVHRHSGLGLRKIHPSGIYEVRVGLGIRLVFGIQGNSVILHRVGKHVDVQRFLKNL